MPVIICHSCRQSIDITPPVPRSATCLRCQEDLRCCRNCRFYDAAAYRSCREELASWVKEKDQGNFCSYFNPALAQGDAAAHAAAAKAGLEALFAPAPEPAPDGGAKSALSADLERFLRARR